MNDQEHLDIALKLQQLIIQTKAAIEMVNAGMLRDYKPGELKEHLDEGEFIIGDFRIRPR